MDQEVKNNLLSLSFVNALPQKPGQEQCWLDGTRCPYGRPEGQFALRPKTFCHPVNGSHGGCMKLNDNREEVLETIEEGTPVTLMDWLSKHEPQKISEILSEIVEGEISDVDEKIVLTSAISILQGNKETDQEIFLAEDLKDE